MSRRDWTLLGVMAAGWGLTLVPGDNYAALRAIGFVGFYGVSIHYWRLTALDGREWLRTHRLRDLVWPTLSRFAYWAPLLFILTRDISGWAKAGWCVAWLIVYVLGYVAAGITRSFLRARSAS